MVVDYTSMVRRTDAEGIVYALALAKAAELAMRPAVLGQDGEIVKHVADTFFAVFKAPGPALAAALDGIAAMRAFNEGRTGHIGDGSRNEPIWPCIGLGFGDTLVVPGEDMYGDEVNRAFVLGEDTAERNEILCSLAFLDALDGLPEGVGAHRAPADREEATGFSFHVLKDYR